MPSIRGILAACQEVRFERVNSTFVHLHLHSEYSLVDGLIRVRPLVKAVMAARMPAVAVTEQGNLFSFVKFYQAACAAGVKPIIGAELEMLPLRTNAPMHRVVFLCLDLEGYRDLARLVSQGYTLGQVRGRPTLRPEWLTPANTRGLIALSGGLHGDIGQAFTAGRRDEAARCAHFWQRLFPDRFYLELTRTGRAGEDLYIEHALALAAEADLPVVATNDVRFLRKEDFDAHEARVCIHDGRVLNDPRRPKRYSEQQYLRGVDEMQTLFADLPQALENTVEIAKRCNVEIQFGETFLPEFPVPDGSDVGTWFQAQSYAGLEARLNALFDTDSDSFPANAQRYRERLRIELDVITSMGFAGYFLIVADFIGWAKDNGVPVGPGRGSGAGSLVAYALGITELDPIFYELLFERFLNS